MKGSLKQQIHLEEEISQKHISENTDEEEEISYFNFSSHFSRIPQGILAHKLVC